MSKGADSNTGDKSAELSKQVREGKPSLMTRLKKLLPWSKKSKSKDMEIYPLF